MKRFIVFLAVLFVSPLAQGSIVLDKTGVEENRSQEVRKMGGTSNESV